MFDYLAQVLILVDVDKTRLAKFVNQNDVSVYICDNLIEIQGGLKFE